ncbi:Sensor protein FixL [Methylobrevis pamukkalensis]|uniref:histidine kinase n=2 Tax=Methylobrevis pamukkalensis TaxID=1439726 RepID=A0A1E3H8K1_9HYPH|nr:PAS domain-containing protein [Methylobrevis pamukkalensis]ODN72614.1 Sensor protein FixL [Methylobrevis pamukkalensis]
MTRWSSYELLRSIEMRGKVGTWVWDVPTGAVEWSPGLYRIFGVDPATPASLELYQRLLHPDDRLDLDTTTMIRDSGTIFDRELRIIRPDGTMRWLRGYGDVLVDGDGEVRQAAGVVFDITTERAMTDALKRTSLRNASLSARLGGVIWVADPAGIVTDLHGWSELTGQGLADVQRNGWLDVVHPEDLVATRQTWLGALEQRTGFTMRYRIRCQDGAYRRFEATATPVLNRDGQMVELVGICLPVPETGGKEAGGRETASAATAEQGLTPGQLRAARAALGWSIADLAAASGVSVSTIRRMETGHPDRQVNVGFTETIRGIFRREGVVVALANGRVTVSFDAGR